jgi:hypothetical protein
MNHWDTSMRYAPGEEITPEYVELWHEQADGMVDAMGAK